MIVRARSFRRRQLNAVVSSEMGEAHAAKQVVGNGPITIERLVGDDDKQLLAAPDRFPTAASVRLVPYTLADSPLGRIKLSEDFVVLLNYSDPYHVIEVVQSILPTDPRLLSDRGPGLRDQGQAAVTGCTKQRGYAGISGIVDLLKSDFAPSRRIEIEKAESRRCDSMAIDNNSFEVLVGSQAMRILIKSIDDINRFPHQLIPEYGKRIDHYYRSAFR